MNTRLAIFPLIAIAVVTSGVFVFMSDNEQTYEDEKMPAKMITITNMDQSSKDAAYEGIPADYMYFWPQRSLTFPEQVKVGEEFDVVMDYSFIIPSLDDDDNAVEFLNYDDPEEICSVEDCGHLKIRVSLNEAVELINRDDDYVFDSNFTNTQYTIHLSSHSGWVTVPFNNTHPQQETFTLKINEPITDYRFGTILITHVPASDDEAIYFYVGHDNIVQLSDEEISILGEGPSQLVEDLPYLVSSNAPTVNQEDPSDEHIPGIAEFFRDYFPKDHDFGQELRSNNFTQAFIDKFFGMYPDLKPQSFMPSSLYWIMPQAFAQSAPSFTHVTGAMKYYNSSSALTTLGNVKICAFDTESGKLTALFNGRTQVCKFSSDNGSFSLQVPTTDPNGSGGTDLVLMAYSENPNAVVYENNNQNVHSITSTKTPPNLTSSMHNYGDFVLLQTQISNKAFWVIDELNSLKDWYKDELNVTAPRAYVVWDPKSCGGVGIDPTSKVMRLEDTVKFVNDVEETCGNSIISPLGNSDTLAHEYAHIQFFHNYDSKNSSHPGYSIGNPSGYHSPVHQAILQGLHGLKGGLCPLF